MTHHIYGTHEDEIFAGGARDHVLSKAGDDEIPLGTDFLFGTRQDGLDLTSFDILLNDDGVDAWADENVSIMDNRDVHIQLSISQSHGFRLEAG